jgi:hypothetical protein
MENADARELTRAIEALNNNLGNLIRNMDSFSTSTIASNPEAAGRAQAMADINKAFASLATEAKDSASAIKSATEEEKKNTRAAAEQKNELSTLLKRYRDINESIESELRLRKEGLRLNEEQLKREREILTAQYANEQAETRAKIKSLGYEVPEGEKGILSQLKDHFIKSDASIKGLALSGGVMAISMALDAIKSLWGGIKDEVKNMNKELRQSQQSALGAQSGIGTGDFQTQQLKVARNMVEADRFFIAAGVSADQFAEAMIVNSRRLNESLSDSGAMRQSIEEMTLHARSAGVAMREYQDTVVELTRTNQMDISQKDRAMAIADRIYATERSLNLEKGYLLNNIKSTYQSLATMGYSIENVVGLNIRFADSIKAGRMSLNDIVDYAKGMKDATEGQRLFFGRAIQQYGSAQGRNVESAVREMSGGDPVQYAYLMQRLIEGTVDNNSALAKATGLTDKTSASFMRGEADTVAQSMYMARGGTAAGAEAWADRFRGIFGMATPKGTFARGQILDAAGQPLLTGTEGPSSEQLQTLKTSTSKLVTMDENLGIIKDSLINYFAEKMYGINRFDMQKPAMEGDYRGMVQQYKEMLKQGASQPEARAMLNNTLSQLSEEQIKKLREKSGGGNTFNLIGDPAIMRRVLEDYAAIEGTSEWREENTKIDDINRKKAKGYRVGG